MSEAREIVAGFPRRDASAPEMDRLTGVMAYADPTQGPDNGKAMLGLIMKVEPDSMLEKHDHIVASSVINPTDTLDYYWGFAWDRAEIRNMEDWKRYLVEYSYAIKTPLIVIVK